MSFFIKGKATSNKPVRNKYTNQKQGVKRKAKKQKPKPEDDEVSSDEDENLRSVADKSSSEDEHETAQEKKLRLAKIYLEEIEKEERQRLEDAETLNDGRNGDVISKRLKVDYLKQAGKLKLSVADQYKGVDNIVVLKCKEHKSAVTCLCVSPDNKYIFSGSKDGSLVKWSLLEHKKVASLPFVKQNLVSTTKEVLGHSKQILSIAISSDNKYLAVGDGNNVIHVWNPTDLKHLGSLRGHRDSVTGLAFRRDTHTLYSCSKDKSVKVWSLDEMSYVETLYGHQDGITAIDALTRERAVTSGGRDTSIRIWKIAEESQLIYNGHLGSIDVVRLINEENFVSGGDDGQLCVWSAMKKKPLCTVKNAHGQDSVNSQPHWIASVASLLNTDLIASGSDDGFIRLWKLGENFRTISSLFTVEITGFVNDMSFTSDGKFLIASIGIEHKFGRWTVIKSAKNSVVIIPLIKNK